MASTRPCASTRLPARRTRRRSSMAKAGAPEWTLVAAAHQTAGRGRLGRSWIDRPGGALMFSLVLRPSVDARAAPACIPLAGRRRDGGCDPRCGGRGRCDASGRTTCWSTDRKVGGILAESSVADGRLDHVVVGIGVNLEPPASVDAAAGHRRRGSRRAADVVPPAVPRRDTVDVSSSRSSADAWSALSATIGRSVEVTRRDGRLDPRPSARRGRARRAGGRDRARDRDRVLRRGEHLSGP